MFRILAVLLDVLSACFALLTPVVVVHWILGGLGVPGIEVPVETLSRAFEPVNLQIAALSPIPLPAIQYDGRDIGTAQGILAFIMTLCFFGLALMANMLRTTDKKMAVSQSLSESRARLQQDQRERDAVDRTTTEKTEVMVWIQFPFPEHERVATMLRTFPPEQGHMVHQTDEACLLRFSRIHQAMTYVVQATQQVVRYYGTLRPKDPKPPFQMTLHAVHPEDQAGLTEGPMNQRILRNTGDNEVLLSQQVIDLLRIHELQAQYPTQSLGMFSFDNEPDGEIFKLTAVKHDVSETDSLRS